MTEPIASDEDGAPVAYPALSACFHLEPLEVGDKAHLADAVAAVHEALGGDLKHVWASFSSGAEPYSESMLEYVPWQCTRLEVPALIEGPLPARIQQHTRGDFNVFAAAAGDPRAISPVSFKFWSESRASRSMRR